MKDTESEVSVRRIPDRFRETGFNAKRTGALVNLAVSFQILKGFVGGSDDSLFKGVSIRIAGQDDSRIEPADFIGCELGRVAKNSVHAIVQQRVVELRSVLIWLVRAAMLRKSLCTCCGVALTGYIKSRSLGRITVRTPIRSRSSPNM